MQKLNNPFFECKMKGEHVFAWGFSKYGGFLDYYCYNCQYIPYSDYLNMIYENPCYSDTLTKDTKHSLFCHFSKSYCISTKLFKAIDQIYSSFKTYGLEE